MCEFDYTYKLNEHQTRQFMPILARAYEEMDLRPALCGIACVEYENNVYLCGTDGNMALFLRINEDIPVGTYEGIPYMVLVPDGRLYGKIMGLLDQRDGLKYVVFREGDNIEIRSASVCGVIDVVTAHASKDGFVVDILENRTHIFRKDLYFEVLTSLGAISHVYYGAPDKNVWFMSDLGFAIVMPMKPDAEIKFFQ